MVEKQIQYFDIIRRSKVRKHCTRGSQGLAWANYVLIEQRGQNDIETHVIPQCPARVHTCAVEDMNAEVTFTPITRQYSYSGMSNYINRANLSKVFFRIRWGGDVRLESLQVIVLTSKRILLQWYNSISPCKKNLTIILFIDILSVDSDHFNDLLTSTWYPH